MRYITFVTKLLLMVIFIATLKPDVHDKIYLRDNEDDDDDVTINNTATTIQTNSPMITEMPTVISTIF